MAHRHRRIYQQLFSSFMLMLLFLSYLPVRAANDPTNFPQPQRQVQLKNQTAKKQIGYLSNAATGDPLQIAMNYLRTNRFQLGLTDDDLAEIVVKDRYVSQNNGVTHLYLRQRLDGIELFNGDINVNIMPDGRILNLGNRFVSDLRSRVKQNRTVLDAVSAVRSVAEQLNLPVTQALIATSSARGVDRATEVSDGGFSAAAIPVRLIYQQVAGGNVQLAWNITIRPINSSDWLDIRADAATGKILSTVNWTSEAAADHHHATGNTDNKEAQNLPAAGSTTNSYLVYALPFESPFDGSQSVVNSPADAVASPFGWHDTNGSAGAEYTTTQGNNTFTYADLVAPDGFDTGDATTVGGVDLNFIYSADLNQPPAANRDAAITNLFYVTNRVHDILYHFGFDEASGNFQANNYGNGGAGNDSVAAEAQDYSGVNNANFATPPDGFAPRMQMYLGGIATGIDVTSPITIAGPKDSAGANFGPTQFSTSGNVVLVDDNTDTTSDGCNTPFANAAALNGKIALIDRGGCGFAVKVKNAQTNGAIAAIIVNNDASAPFTMGGSDATITIPSVMISLADGNAIKAELPSATVSATMSGAQRDGSLDNGVIIHEYGHGLSNRLTGGPSNSSCLDAIESGGMGEGWSDFLALVLTAKPSNTATTPIPMGRWLIGNPSSGDGIRRYPYTTDLNDNPLTFDSTSLSDEVHDVGEIWAAMLWEVYWNLVADYGFDADLLSGTGGNKLALQLVIDGMKLQPCAPNFVEARDAILAADLANNQGVNQCRIWEGFAKRGLGYSATAGSSADSQDGNEAFDLPDSCMVDVQPTVLNVCSPNNAVYDIALGGSFEGSATLSVENVPAGASSSISPNPITAPTHATLTLGNTGVVTPGAYAIGVVGTGITQVHTTTVQLNLASASPATPNLTAPADQEIDVSDAPLFQWDAVPQASHYLFELASDADFATLIYTTTTASTNTRIPFYLRSERTYYWRLTAQNGCGDSSSSSASFTVRVFPPILLVDDDSDDGVLDMGPYFAFALDALGANYDYWDTGLSGTDEPSRLDDIADYSMVIWFTGLVGAAPEPETEPILAQFLDEGKCFFISAQDYYYHRGVTPFMHDYLGVEEATDDLSDGMSWHSVVTGTAPFFDGLGPYTLLYPNDNYSDLITPTVSAGVAFVGNAGNAAVYKDGGHFRTTYWGFEYENLPTEQALVENMLSVLNFCGFQTDLGIEQSVAPQGTVRPGQPVTYTLTFSNTSIATATGVLITATLPANLADPTVTSQGVTITPTVAAPYLWQVSDLAYAQTGTITVTGMVSPLLSADSFLQFSASIGADNFDKNLLNNQTSAVTLTAIVPRIQLINPSVTVSEAIGTIPIAVTLDQANPYAPATARLTSNNGSAESSSDYSALNSTVIVPAGALTASLPLTINEDLLVELSEAFSVALSNPAGAALGTKQTETITITDSDLPAVGFASANVSGKENNGTATVTVTLDQPHPYATVNVDYVASDGSAKSGLDYVSNSGTLTFTANVTATTFTIQLIDDSAVELAESLLLTLSNPHGALPGALFSSTLTIIDSDLPVVRFEQSAYSQSEASGMISATVVLDQPNPREDVVIGYRTLDDSALAGSDYTSINDTITISRGETSATISIPLIDDSQVEADEQFILQQTSQKNATAGSPISTVLTIANDDATPQPKLSGTMDANVPSGATIYVGDTITFTLTISNSGGPANNLVITATVPTNTVYVNGSATPAPEVASAAVSRVREEQLLVWRVASLAANQEMTITYALRIVADSGTLQSIVSGSIGDAPIPISNPVTFSVEERNKVYLPVVSR